MTVPLSGSALAAFGPIWAAEDPWYFRLTVLSLIAALLLGALIVAWVSRWRRGDGRLSPTADEQLAQFRSLYEAGEMSEEEFRKVRTLLGGQIRRQLNLPAPQPRQDAQAGPERPTPENPPGPPDGIRPG
jgi:type VI protein secretion system component VasK